MVKHMIIWKLKDEIANKEQRAKEIKTALEGLVRPSVQARLSFDYEI